MLVSKVVNGTTEEQAHAELMVEGMGMNAVTARAFSKGLGTLDLTECMVAVSRQAEKVQAGDTGGLEALLTAQAISLNAIFTQFANRSELNAGSNPEAVERYMRLALRAQGQCRATVETLALVKGGPRTVFTRSANIVNGPQQVNAAPAGLEESRARAGEVETLPIELLEAHEQRLDVGTSRAPGARDQAVAALAQVNGTEKH
jgi:hypothetical protein